MSFTYNSGMHTTVLAGQAQRYLRNLQYQHQRGHEYRTILDTIVLPDYEQKCMVREAGHTITRFDTQVEAVTYSQLKTAQYAVEDMRINLNEALRGEQDNRIALRDVIRSAIVNIDHRKPAWRFSRLLASAYRPAQRLAEVRAVMQKVGREFAAALRDEDHDALCDLLNSGLTREPVVTRGIQRQLVERYTSYHNCDEDRLWHCDCCHDWQHGDYTYVTRNSSDEQWCESCAEDAQYSHAMECYIARDDAEEYYTSAYAFDRGEANDCATRQWLRENDAYNVYNPHVGGNVWCDEDVHDHWEEDYNEAHIASYHCGERVGFIATDYRNRTHKVYCGVEFEFEFESGHDRTRCIRAIRGDEGMERYGCMEQDGSLDVGFEFVSGYTGLDTHARYAKQLLQHANEYDAIDGARTTGLHVHVSRCGMSAWHLTKLAAWVYDPDNRDFIEYVAGREIGGDYCTDVNYRYAALTAGRRHREAKEWDRRFMTKEDLQQHVMGAFQDGDRYGALSYATSQGDRTVEFRMFAGTTNFKRVMASIEFAFISWHFAHQGGMGDMNPNAFAKFICRPDNRKDTKYLREFLAHHKAVQAADAPYKAKPRKVKA